MKNPFEDTQLAFYAALMAGDDGGGGEAPALQAAYVALDGSEGVQEIDAPRRGGERAGARRRPGARLRAAARRRRAACARRGVELRALRGARPVPARPLGRRRVTGAADAGGRAAYRRDGVLVAREAFYAAACDPQLSCVVEACAGAGKTWMLVSRILRALLDGAEPHDILAITFTRKAAGEMRERLDEWLAHYASPATPDAELAQALVERGLDAAAARRAVPALRGLHARVLSSGRPVEIRTFHAWFSQLLGAAPLELLDALGLRRDLTLLEDEKEHAVDVFRRFHAAVSRDAALAADYRALVERRGRSDARRWLEAAWGKRVELALADEAGVLASSVEPATLARRRRPAAASGRGAARGALARGARRAGGGALRRPHGHRPQGRLPPGGRSRRRRRPGRCAGPVRGGARRAFHRQGHAAQPPRHGRTARHRMRRPAGDGRRHRPARGLRRAPRHGAPVAHAAAPSTPPSSASAGWPTWPTSNAARSPCSATPRSPAGCRSGSTCACATC